MVSRRAKFALWWRDAGLRLRLLLFVLGAASIGFLMYLQRPDGSVISSSNLLVFGLVNFNIVVLLVLAFMIGRNIVKLVFDRRHNILGSKLRLRLVLAFIGLALVPTVALFVFSSGLLTKAMEGWFNSQVEEAFSQSVKIAQQHYSLLERVVNELSERATAEVAQKPLTYKDSKALSEYLEAYRKKYQLFSISVRDSDGQPLVESHNVAAEVETFQEPAADQKMLERALRGHGLVVSEQAGAAQFIRSYFPLHYQDRRLALVLTLRLSDDLGEAMTVVTQSYREYKQLQLFKGPLKSGYLLTLALMTTLILFSAIWIGFYIAREISVPIQRLAEGTRIVARGNYDFQIREQGDDEISFLVRSFNSMIGELRRSRAEVEQRTLYIETILSNLAVGVVGIDPDRHVTLINSAAARLFGIINALARIGEELQVVIGGEVAAEVGGLLTELDSSEAGQDAVDRELNIVINGSERKVICTAGKMLDAKKSALGAVLLFEDVTDLLQAEQMAAWREVARRIAHEIKNPLTPIQLSAQRLKRLVESQGSKAAVDESAQTIVENVDSIKRLINEFSNFARMPTAQFEQNNLNYLIADTIAPFVESNPEIIFHFIADKRLPQVQLDREQIRRVIINLVDNSIAALAEAQRPVEGERPCITLRSGYDPRKRMANFEVLDNGPGIPARAKSRIFEPYFTTKKKGTGLGLAIVNSVVADHQGQIRVYDNPPRGSRFVVELPLFQRMVTQRRGQNDG